MKTRLLTIVLTLWCASAHAEESFNLDVMPVFFRAGCNSGSCHGAAAGKDGFMLSLFGYDPQGDYFRLTQQYIGRRIDLAVPEQSLLLEKAIGAVPHTGGKLFEQDSEYYQTLLQWIREGALPDGDEVAEVTGIELTPKKIVFTGEGSAKQGKVIATYSDGSRRDVTNLALYLASNESIASIDESAMIRAEKRGGAHVFARFSKFTVGSEVIVLPAKDEFQWAATPQHNYIDRLVNDKLQKLRIQPSDLCTDEQFLRRVSIDLTGVLPTVQQFEAFMQDDDPEKRSRLIDELLRSPEFTDLWATKWGEALRIRGDTNPGSGTAMKAAWNYYYWIREQIEQDVPLDQFVRSMVRGTGSNFRDPPANYYNMLSQGHIDALKVSEDTAQLFLGIRTQCAQCHNHPFDRWTMDDYYSWMSFFTGIRRKHGAEAREYYVYNDDTAPPATHPVHGRWMEPAFLGAGVAETEGKDPRRALAKWMTSTDNALFRKNMANRIWAHFFGRGIVEPIDDFRISNPPSNAELLDELGRKLAEGHAYDLRKLVRDICNSRTYQLSSSTNASNRDDTDQFSHAYVRRPRADVLLDCIAAAGSAQFRFRRHTASRAIQLFEGGQKENYNMYFLKTFGQASRESVCACDDNTEATLSQALHLLNGETVNRRTISDTRLCRKMVEGGKSDEEIVENLYIRTFTRRPTDSELSGVKSFLKEGMSARQREEVFDDLFWALLNSEEFIFNH